MLKAIHKFLNQFNSKNVLDNVYFEKPKKRKGLFFKAKEGKALKKLNLRTIYPTKRKLK